MYMQLPTLLFRCCCHLRGHVWGQQLTATHLHQKQPGVDSPAGEGVVGVTGTGDGVVGVTGAGDEVATGGGGGGEDEGVVDEAPGTHCQ